MDNAYDIYLLQTSTYHVQHHQIYYKIFHSKKPPNFKSLSISPQARKALLSSLQWPCHTLGTMPSDIANLASVSSLLITELGSSLQFATKLASLPREVRDMVYRYVFSDRNYNIGFGKRYYISSPGNRRADALLISLHEEALRS